jgi:predicted ATPase
MLLVDNFEHVINATPILVRLRSECPLLRLLVTSRTALRVRGERQFHLQHLRLPDPSNLPDLRGLLEFSAINLFVDRARAVRPEFILNEQNALSVVSICHRLDGLPLAIELIATNLRILTTDMLLDSLNNGGLLESGELLDLEPRQRTLRDALDWSYNLLTPQEQSLRTAAVFSGGWSLKPPRRSAPQHKQMIQRSLRYFRHRFPTN